MKTIQHDRTSAPLDELTMVAPQRANSSRYQRIPASDPRPWQAGRPLDLAGLTVAADGRLIGLEEFTESTWGTSLVVIADGSLRHEWYADDVAPGTALLGASMTKSVLAHLVADAIGRGRLGLETTVEQLVPELAGTGYAGVTVAQLLSMTSGVAWVEDYRDPRSPATRLIGCFGPRPSSSRAVLRAIGPGARPGSRYAYNTADSQVLDWVRERATGEPATEALARLWADLGCTWDAWMLTDADGVALAGGGLAAAATDWARVGELQLRGSLGAARLPRGWVERSSRPSQPFLRPGRLPSTITAHAGFGYHWWPLDDDGARVTADGSRGQFCFVDRIREVVVVKTSRWPHEDFLGDRSRRDLCYLTLPAIAQIA